MSGSIVDTLVGVGWTIPIRVEKSSWASRRRMIIITIVALVSIMSKTIADLGLRSATGGLMWWWEGTTTTALPALATSAATKRWSRVVVWSAGGGMNCRRRDEGGGVWISDSTFTINLLAKH